METQTKKQQQHDQRATVASEYLLVWDWKSAKKRSKQQKTTANSTKKSVEYTAIIINKAMLEELLYRRFCTAKWFHVWTQSFIPSLMIAVRFFRILYKSGDCLLFHPVEWRLLAILLYSLALWNTNFSSWVYCISLEFSLFWLCWVCSCPCFNRIVCHLKRIVLMCLCINAHVFVCVCVRARKLWQSNGT